MDKNTYLSHLEKAIDNKIRFQLLPIPFDEDDIKSNRPPKGHRAITDELVNILHGKERESRSWDQGICLHDEVKIKDRDTAENVIEIVEKATTLLLNNGPQGLLPTSCVPPLPTMTMPACKGASVIPLLVGGSNAVSLGAMRALKLRYKNFGIIHFSAHAKLKNVISSCSSVSIMRQALDELSLPLFQIGVRDVSAEEKTYRKKEKTLSLDAGILRCPKPWPNTCRKKSPGRPIPPLLPSHFPELVYVSFSVDAFDMTLMPATKRPEPGGLFWWDALHLIQRSLSGRILIGFDIVDLAPIEGFKAYNHTAASLLYKAIEFIEPNSR